MKIGILLTCAALASAASIAGAAVVVYEGFAGYPNDGSTQLGNLPDGTNPGNSAGWNAGTPWALSPASGGLQTGSSTAVLGSGNLAAPSGYVYDSRANDGLSSATHISDVGGGMIRTFASANLLNLGTDNTTYFSFLWSESGSGGGGNINISFLDTATFGRKVFDLVTASSQLSLRANNTATTIGSTGFTAGATYLLVGKIQSTASGADTVSASIFSSSSTIGSEPVTWDLTGSLDASDTGRVLNRLYVTGSGNIDRFDEFRMGDSFLDVTGVPEPSTAALLLGFAALGFILWRRRQY